jgi:hypothetical protein
MDFVDGVVLSDARCQNWTPRGEILKKVGDARCQKGDAGWKTGDSEGWGLYSEGNGNPAWRKTGHAAVEEVRAEGKA